ncbi:MAG: ABC transporter permease [Actinomycetota bacterium]|nr:ABC transporter permease [Actinomycetota bacterium]MDA8207765.1 ABC transporter permease [Actinomycetota bacterium]
MGGQVGATARRVLLQLLHDRRTSALLLVVPSVLMTLVRYAFTNQPQVFEEVGPMLLALFPFTVMFVVASVAMLRERSNGTLERLLASPARKGGLLAGYALAFGAATLAQVAVVLGVSLWGLSLKVDGSIWLVVLFALLDAWLGMALGLFLSAFARTEFQAVQFLPAFVLPQFLLCGLLVPRDQMAGALHLLSDFLPLSYAVDGVSRVASSGALTGALWTDLVVVAACIPVALALGALTLQRKGE